MFDRLMKWLGAKEASGMVEVNLTTGTQIPVSKTDKGKLYAKIASNHCPDCNGEGFLAGPSGGMSQNIMCANEQCGARFNVTPVIGIAERI